MPTISGGTIQPGYGPYLFAAPPGAAVNAVQTLTQSGSVSAGTFTLSFRGASTAPIAFGATAAAIDTALELLPTIGANGVTCGGGPLPGTPVTVTFNGTALAGQNVPLIQVGNSGLTGGTFTVANTTPGGPASGPNALQGAIGIDQSTGLQYTNVGGTWTKTGTQTLMADGRLAEPQGRQEEDPNTEEDDAEEPDEEAPPDETDDQRRSREERRDERQKRREERREERRNPRPTPHESSSKAVKKPPEDKGAR
jgi:hypothetical protein